MAVLELPTSAGFRSVQFGLQTNTAIFQSPTNQARQTLELPGAQWFATWEVTRMTLANAAAWKGFMVELMGAAGRFNGYDPSRTTPFGAYSSGSDTPLVRLGSQIGKSIDTDGWRVSGTNLLLPGDTFEIAINSIRKLFMVTAAVNSDGGGLATISISPPLPASPADNAALVFDTPKVEMMLVSDSQTIWNVPVDKLISGFAFSGIEAF